MDLVLLLKTFFSPKLSVEILRFLLVRTYFWTKIFWPITFKISPTFSNLSFLETLRWWKMCKKSQGTIQFWTFGVFSFWFQNPDSLGVNFTCKWSSIGHWSSWPEGAVWPSRPLIDICIIRGGLNVRHWPLPRQSRAGLGPDWVKLLVAP